MWLLPNTFGKNMSHQPCFPLRFDLLLQMFVHKSTISWKDHYRINSENWNIAFIKPVTVRMENIYITLLASFPINIEPNSFHQATFFVGSQIHQINLFVFLLLTWYTRLAALRTKLKMNLWCWLKCAGVLFGDFLRIARKEELYTWFTISLGDPV